MQRPCTAGAVHKKSCVTLIHTASAISCKHAQTAHDSAHEHQHCISFR
jgi:hypothetical protein